MTTVVSIGRNVGGEPMSPGRWRAFRHETQYAVERYTGPVVFSGEGIGSWTTTDGEGNEVRETEQAATIIGAGDPTAGEISDLRHHLAILAAEYRQEAIAAVSGVTTFVGPDPTYRITVDPDQERAFGRTEAEIARRLYRTRPDGYDE